MEIVREQEKFEIIAHIKEYDAKVRNFHWHDKYEVCVILDNSLNILIDGTLIEAKKGDMVTISEHTVHRFIVENKASIMIIQFPVKIILNSPI